MQGKRKALMKMQPKPKKTKHTEVVIKLLLLSLNCSIHPCVYSIPSPCACVDTYYILSVRDAWLCSVCECAGVHECVRACMA